MTNTLILLPWVIYDHQYVSYTKTMKSLYQQLEAISWHSCNFLSICAFYHTSNYRAQLWSPNCLDSITTRPFMLLQSIAEWGNIPLLSGNRIVFTIYMEHKSAQLFCQTLLYVCITVILESTRHMELRHFIHFHYRHAQAYIVTANKWAPTAHSLARLTL